MCYVIVLFCPIKFSSSIDAATNHSIVAPLYVLYYDGLGLIYSVWYVDFFLVPSGNYTL